MAGAAFHRLIGGGQGLGYDLTAEDAHAITLALGGEAAKEIDFDRLKGERLDHGFQGGQERRLHNTSKDCRPSIRG